MKTRILEILDDVQTSYWFIPTVMALGAFGLSLFAVRLDAWVGTSGPDWLSWLFDNQPEGARAVLSTIAGSMMTVAGVVFSITLVSVSNAAFQFGPRLLTNFMRDRTNQITLGTFIATFLYCLMVLRAVQSVPPTAGPEEAAQFVPHISILGALVLAVCSIAVLIRFFHHAPESIHVSNVLARIGAEFAERLDDNFPVRLGDGADQSSIEQVEAYAQRFQKDGVDRVLSQRTGYIRIVDTEQLIDIARAHDFCFLLIKRPGDFVSVGECLMQITGGTPSKRDACLRELCECVVVGPMRSPMQDIDFLASELSEIAMRALSPGINDPETAETAANWLGAGLTHVGKRETVSALRMDEEGVVRVLSPVTSFESLLVNSLGRIAPDFARNVAASTAFIAILNRLSENLSGDRKQKVKKLKSHFRDLAKAALTDPEFVQVFGAAENNPVESLARRATRQVRSFLSF